MRHDRSIAAGKRALAERFGSDLANHHEFELRSARPFVGPSSRQLTAWIGPTGVPTVPLPQTVAVGARGSRRPSMS
jgi:hypothetical protein